MSYPLTLVEFKSWLESKKEDDVVGSSGKRYCCPIANALKDIRLNTTRFSSVMVDSSLTVIQGEEYENPNWVYKFVDIVDGLTQIEVKAKDALQIVNNFYICTVCNQYNPEGTNCGKKDNCPW